MTEAERIIREEMGQTGPMTWARFMELALYHPVHGYYAADRPADPIGRRGDFFTSVSVGPLFGRLLGRQFLQMWEIMGRPDPFWVMEQGAHRGELVRDILRWCREAAADFFRAMRYGIIKSPGAAQELQKRVVQEEGLTASLQWFEDLAALGRERPEGVFFSNELVDSFPVHAIVFHQGEWWERRVGLAQEMLAWEKGPIRNSNLQAAIAKLPLPSIEGYTTEISLQARAWMDQVARALHRGFVVTIDYGFPASIYYAPFRTAGTLTGYRRHRRSDHLLGFAGEQDLTAHVDFTALTRVGKEAGLGTGGVVDQQRFLTGIAYDELAGHPGPRVDVASAPRAWQTLTHPGHLGSRFQVLVQATSGLKASGLDGLRFAREKGLD